MTSLRKCADSYQHSTENCRNDFQRHKHQFVYFSVAINKTETWRRWSNRQFLSHVTPDTKSWSRSRDINVTFQNLCLISYLPEISANNKIIRIILFPWYQCKHAVTHLHTHTITTVTFYTFSAHTIYWQLYLALYCLKKNIVQIATQLFLLHLWETHRNVHIIYVQRTRIKISMEIKCRSIFKPLLNDFKFKYMIKGLLQFL